MRLTIPFLIFLLGPTLLLGVVSLGFLHREVDRMEEERANLRQAKISSLEQVAANSASNIRLNFEEVREGFEENLQTLDRDGLMTLPEVNPLVADAWFWAVGEDMPEGTRQGWRPEQTPWEESVPPEDDSPAEQVREEAGEEPAAPEARARGYRKVEGDEYVVANVEVRRQLNVLSRQQSLPYAAEEEGKAPAPSALSDPGDVALGLEEHGESWEGPLAESFAEPRQRRALRESLVASGEGGWMWSENDGQRQYIGWWQDGREAGVKLLSLDLAVLRDELSALLPKAEEGVEWSLASSSGAPREKRLGIEGSLQGGVSPGGDLSSWQVRFLASPPESGYAPTLVRWLGSFLLLGVMASIGLGGLLLQRQSSQAEREARRKTNFVANVSHELRTPLSSIRLYAEMLGQKQRSEEQLARYAGVLQRESGRLERLVNNLLQLTRAENGKTSSVEETLLDLQKWLPEFAEEKRPEAEGAGLVLHTEGPAESLPVKTDPVVLRQILENLLENAFKYASSGDSIVLRAMEHGESWRITVADRGPGISREFQDRMFDRFTRGDDSLEQAQGGLGIGLSIAREMAQRIGAELFYEDRPGGGSVFVLHYSQNEKTPFNRRG
ncbi:MAG: HAMP domain-containing histidine kinase [Opitutales bacterium]|nr:HAMP domain-containing histidine kinase [Opitutales bacterium]MCH8541870.1 HAMP domain-containing histidine kinase [Opitutales bacterium]